MTRVVRLVGRAQLDTANKGEPLDRGGGRSAFQFKGVFIPCWSPLIGVGVDLVTATVVCFVSCIAFPSKQVERTDSLMGSRTRVRPEESRLDEPPKTGGWGFEVYSCLSEPLDRGWGRSSHD
jgi:hypothetical protein